MSQIETQRYPLLHNINASLNVFKITWDEITKWQELGLQPKKILLNSVYKNSYKYNILIKIFNSSNQTLRKYIFGEFISSLK